MLGHAGGRSAGVVWGKQKCISPKTILVQPRAKGRAVSLETSGAKSQQWWLFEGYTTGWRLLGLLHLSNPVIPINHNLWVVPPLPFLSVSTQTLWMFLKLVATARRCDLDGAGEENWDLGDGLDTAGEQKWNLGDSELDSLIKASCSQVHGLDWPKLLACLTMMEWSIVLSTPQPLCKKRGGSSSSFPAWLRNSIKMKHLLILQSTSEEDSSAYNWT